MSGRNFAAREKIEKKAWPKVNLRIRPDNPFILQGREITIYFLSTDHRPVDLLRDLPRLATFSRHKFKFHSLPHCCIRNSWEKERSSAQMLVWLHLHCSYVGRYTRIYRGFSIFGMGWEGGGCAEKGNYLPFITGTRGAQISYCQIAKVVCSWQNTSGVY